MATDRNGFGRGKKRGLTKTLMSLGPEQREVLRQEANRRAQERNVLRPDASEVAREAIDLWRYLRTDTYHASLEILDAISALAKRLEGFLSQDFIGGSASGGLAASRRMVQLAEQAKAELRDRARELKAEVESLPPAKGGWVGDAGDPGPALGTARSAASGQAPKRPRRKGRKP